MEKRDSFVDLLTAAGGSNGVLPYPKPPPIPKPLLVRGARTRRASSVTSPYGTPKKQSGKFTPGVSPMHERSTMHDRRKSRAEIDLTVEVSGKNVFDLRDELVRVSRSLRDVRGDKEELTYEIARLKKLVDKKEKEVEDLLVGGYVGQKDRSRVAGASTKQDTLLALSALKHRVHTLERTLRFKEEELSSLRRDIKTTRLKELQTEKEVYYAEIIRLQGVTDRLKAELSGEVPQSRKYLRNKMEEQTRVIKKLKETSNIMATELKHHKEQLGLWRKGKPIMDEHETDEWKCLFSKYSKLTQSEVIRQLIDRETRAQDIKRRLQSLSNEHEELKRNYDKELKVKRKEISELNKKINESKSIMRETQNESKKLRDQCLEYRALVEKTRQDLSDTTESLNTLQVDHNQIKSTLGSIRERENEERGIEEREEEVQLRQSSVLKRKDQQKHKSYLSQHQAASVIQKTWKHYVSKKRQKAFERDSEKIVACIQALLRSHRTRMELVRQEDINTITVLQNLFRGHRTRELVQL